MRQVGLKIVVEATLAFALVLSAQAKEPKIQQLGRSTLPSGSVLAFGASANPPTLEHMGILARLMNRFGFAEARLMPTMPYKAGGGTPEQILGLSTVAVDHFDEVLDLNGVAYEPSPTERGEFAWQDGSNSFRLRLDDYDIRSRNSENTLKTLEHLQQKQGGDANRVFWISGGDSFSSVPTWTPQWRDLFDRANWVVISRPGFTENGVDFHSTNPLRDLYDAEFLSHYTYSFDAHNQVHNYLNKDTNKPNIYIVSQPVLNYSSSVARKSLAASDHHHLAQAGLQPSVFRHCLQEGYYGDAADESYRAFTEQNLGIYLRHLLTKLESQTGANHKAWQEEFQTLSKQLISILLETSRSPVKPSFSWRETWAKILKASSETWNMIPRSHNPWEIRTLRRQLAGDLETYSELRNLRNQLLRGDPSQIFSRTMEFGLGLEGKPLEINLIRSRLPAWLPLWIRQRDNNHVTWHDLNVSTNEMAALLRDKRLETSIKSVAGDNATVLTALLRQAIQNKPRALTRYRLFAAARYFKRIALGAISPEILSGFSPSEKAAIEALRKQHQNLDEKLSPLEIERYAEALSHIYALNRVLELEPQRINDTPFWHEFRDLLATNYPGHLYNPNRATQRERLNTLIPLIEEGLKQTLSNEKITPNRAHSDNTPYTLAERALTRLELLLPIHARNTPNSHHLSQSRIMHAVGFYLDNNHHLFAAPSSGPTAKGFEILPIASIGQGMQHGNLIWDIKKLSSQLQREFSTLETSFDAAVERLRTQPTHASSESIFVEARNLVHQKWNQLLFEMKDLEYRVLKAKSLEPFATSETALTGYQDFVSDLTSKSRELQATRENLRTLTQVMLGSISSHLGGDATELRTDVGNLLGIDTESAMRLGTEPSSLQESDRSRLTLIDCSNLLMRL